MQKGVDASEAIRALQKERGWTYKDLQERTGILANTLAAYGSLNPEARKCLGLVNGRKIAAAYGVPLSRLGLSEERELRHLPAPDTLELLAELQDSVGNLQRAQEELISNLRDRLEAAERAIHSLESQLAPLPSGAAARPEK